MYNVVYHAHAMDIAPFLNIAFSALRESVLDLGTNSVMVLVGVKKMMSFSMCVSVNVCSQILQQNAKANVQQAGFSV